MTGESESNARVMRPERATLKPSLDVCCCTRMDHGQRKAVDRATPSLRCRQEQQLQGTSRADLMKRIGAAAGLIGIIGAFALALALQPDPRGMGTHQQLGMPPCTMYQFTGLPCPTCGVTTAFAHIVRLQVLDAIRVQPFCVVVLAIMLLCAAWCAATIVRGNGVSNWLGDRRIKWPHWIWTCVALGLLSWGYKIAIVLMSS